MAICSAALLAAFGCSGAVEGLEVGNGADGGGGGSDAGGNGGRDAGASSDGNFNGLLNPDLTTTWNPGILNDGLTGNPLGSDDLPVRDTVCATVAPSAASTLQSALNSCPSGQVVQLQTGTYSISATLNIPSGVVLRGASSSGATATIVSLQTGKSGPVISIGPANLYDQACYNNNFSPSSVALTADGAKEQSQLSVQSTSSFAVGDLALVDEANTSEVNDGSGGAFMRSQGRAISQRVEIAGVSSGKLTLTSPMHWIFQTSSSAQISRVSTAVTKWAGVEKLWVKNGNNLLAPFGKNYPGEMAGGIELSNAAHCWVKDVQTDGTLEGMHVALTGTYRCVVRDSHFHNAKVYGFDQDNYGVVLRCGAADNLVENNIARYMDKPILFNNSGGGNVVAYNYADNAWCTNGNEELNLDVHSPFPHMELIEGNWAPHMGASATHGNAGYLTFFRNYASSQQPPNPIVWGLTNITSQTSNVLAVQFDSVMLKNTVIGNVLGSTSDASLGVPTDLGTAPLSGTYTGGSPAIFESLGPIATLHGNFNTVNKAVLWDSNISTRTLPPSLYRTSKPGWWPDGMAWPWVDPVAATKVNALPAQQISAAFNYAASDSGDSQNCSGDVNSTSNAYLECQ